MQRAGRWGLELAQSLFNDPKNSSRDIAKTIGVSLATLYRYARPAIPTPPAMTGPRAARGSATATSKRRTAKKPTKKAARRR